jgi:hypothetical protein
MKGLKWTSPNHVYSPPFGNKIQYIGGEKCLTHYDYDYYDYPIKDTSLLTPLTNQHIKIKNYY